MRKKKKKRGVKVLSVIRGCAYGFIVLLGVGGAGGGERLSRPLQSDELHSRVRLCWKIMGDQLSEL